MICQFCKLDIDRPCQTMQDVEQRAQNHVDQCENALKSKEMRSDD